MSRTYNVLRFMGKLAFNRLLNIQKCLLEIADLWIRTITEQTLYTYGCGTNEFIFCCGFALCGAKQIFATPSTAYEHFVCPHTKINLSFPNELPLKKYLHCLIFYINQKGILFQCWLKPISFLQSKLKNLSPNCHTWHSFVTKFTLPLKMKPSWFNTGSPHI